MGGLNIDASRVGYQSPIDFEKAKGGDVGSSNRSMDGWGLAKAIPQSQKISAQGRFPANVIFDECAGRMLDEQSGPCKTGNIKPGTLQGFGKGANTYGEGVIAREYQTDHATGASRFFYCAKASKRERNAGCEEMAMRTKGVAGDTNVTNTLKGPTEKRIGV